MQRLGMGVMTAQRLYSCQRCSFLMTVLVILVAWRRDQYIVLFLIFRDCALGVKPNGGP